MEKLLWFPQWRRSNPSDSNSCEIELEMSLQRSTRWSKILCNAEGSVRWGLNDNPVIWNPAPARELFLNRHSYSGRKRVSLWKKSRIISLDNDLPLVPHLEVLFFLQGVNSVGDLTFIDYEEISHMELYFYNKDQADKVTSFTCRWRQASSFFSALLLVYSFCHIIEERTHPIILQHLSISAISGLCSR